MAGQKRRIPLFKEDFDPKLKAAYKATLDDVELKELFARRRTSTTMGQVEVDRLISERVMYMPELMGLGPDERKRLIEARLMRQSVSMNVSAHRRLQRAGKAESFYDNWEEDRGFVTASKTLHQTYSSYHGVDFRRVIDELIAENPHRPIHILDIGTNGKFMSEVKKAYGDKVEAHDLGIYRRLPAEDMSHQHRIDEIVRERVAANEGGDKDWGDHRKEELAAAYEAIRRNRVENGVKVHVGYSANQPFPDEYFDLVVDTAGGTQYSTSFAEKFRSLNEICRILAPGGRAYVADAFFILDVRHPEPEFDEASALFDDIRKKWPNVTLEHQSGKHTLYARKADLDPDQEIYHDYEISPQFDPGSFWGKESRSFGRRPQH